MLSKVQKPTSWCGGDVHVDQGLPSSFHTSGSSSSNLHFSGVQSLNCKRFLWSYYNLVIYLFFNISSLHCYGTSFYKYLAELICPAEREGILPHSKSSLRTSQPKLWTHQYAQNQTKIIQKLNIQTNNPTGLRGLGIKDHMPSKSFFLVIQDAFWPTSSSLM